MALGANAIATIKAAIARDRSLANYGWLVNGSNIGNAEPLDCTRDSTGNFTVTLTLVAALMYSLQT